MNLLTQFKEYIKKHHLFTKGERVLIAVSGGVDSIVLCELCHQAGYDFVIAHCNFQLRGKESDADEQLVNELKSKYNVEVLVKKIDTEKYATDHKTSIQIAARELRYQWFAEIVANSSMKLNCLITAHHANDQVETLMMNFFRGTGINGLQGILSKDEGFGMQIVRPLLFAKKEVIISFAEEHTLQWREDGSNNTNKYTRNYFRNELIPSIEKVFPSVESNLLDNIDRFKEVNILYQEAIRVNKLKLVETRGNEWHIPLLKLKKTPAFPTVLFEVIKEVGFASSQVPEVIKLMEAETGKFITSKTHKIIINRGWLIISPILSNESNHILIDEKQEELCFSEGTLNIKYSQKTEKIAADEHIAQIDANGIEFPLLLRRWKQGDYFYPLGMNKKKKLSRFFTDSKYSLTEKENAWVIESGNKIVWVVGKRIDNRFKITHQTKRIVIISLAPTK